MCKKFASNWIRIRVLVKKQVQKPELLKTNIQLEKYPLDSAIKLVLEIIGTTGILFDSHCVSFMSKLSL